MSSDDREQVPLYRFWQPRFWLIWLGLGVLRGLILLPYGLQLQLGRALGWVLQRVLAERCRIADTNLRLCFPELSGSDRRRLVNRHFQSLGITVFELGLTWWATDQRLERLVTFEGEEHVRAALAQGRGVILLTGHFAAAELTGRAMRRKFPNLAALYRKNRNPLVDEVLRRGRSRAVWPLIPKDSIRQLLRTLQNGQLVYYAADQAYQRKYSVLVPFFGQPAMTNGALSHIARMSGAPVVPFLSRRLDGGRGYHVTALPALENFPTADIGADAARTNRVIEDMIRLAPEQYYWVHRRFKGRPDLPDPYSGSQATETSGTQV